MDPNTSTYITIQLFNAGRWWDAATLSFTADDFSGRCQLTYLPQYITLIPYYDVADCWACTVNAPVSVVPTEFSGWPAFLDDIIPSGKSRNWWVNFLNIRNLSPFAQNIQLLRHACMAPVGNLRIKEAAQRNTNTPAQSKCFPLNDVVKLQYDFLEYANEQGAAVGGATGAVGFAPKLLLMLDQGLVHIDGDFAGNPLQASAYLTKFARNQRMAIDNDILRAEGIFYRVLTDIFSSAQFQNNSSDAFQIKTIDVTTMMTHEDEVNQQVSLWLPRFDIVKTDGVAIRLGMESIYSILNAAPGSFQDHFYVINIVWRKIRDTTQMSQEEFVKQYVVRDLLNLIFGNSDNHGRNMSFIKYEGDIQFAPIYDFAPMKADPEMIMRLFKWGNGCESAGIVNFKAVALALSEYCNPAELLPCLREISLLLLEIEKRLMAYQCPESILKYPTINFRGTAEKLKQMGILDD